MLLSAKNLEKNKPIADHRKQIFIERVMDPFKLPEVLFIKKKNLKNF